MVWFVTMIAGLFGIYSKGHALVNRPRPADPVLAEVQSLAQRFEGVESSMRDIDRRVTVLEKRGNTNV